MPATPINWKLPHTYNQHVIDEINIAVKWFDTECHNLLKLDRTKLKTAVLGEMTQLQHEESSKKLLFAIYALYYQDYLPDPLNIQFSDIENARWVIKDQKYEVPKGPSDPRLQDAQPSNYKF